MEEKKVNVLVIVLVIIIAILCGVIGYLVGSRNTNKVEEKPKVEEKVAEIPKLSSLKEVDEFFKDGNDDKVRVLTKEEVEEYYKIPKQTAGCSIGAFGYEYGKYVVIAVTDGCVFHVDVTIYENKNEVKTVKGIYSRIADEEYNNVAIAGLFIKGGKLFYMVDKGKEDYMSFEYVDLDDQLKTVTVSEVKAKHGSLD